MSSFIKVFIFATKLWLQGHAPSSIRMNARFTFMLWNIRMCTQLSWEPTVTMYQALNRKSQSKNIWCMEDPDALEKCMVNATLGESRHNIRKMMNRFPEVSQPQKPLKTSKNLGNLETSKLMSIFPETSSECCPQKPQKPWKLSWHCSSMSY